MYAYWFGRCVAPFLFFPQTIPILREFPCNKKAADHRRDYPEQLFVNRRLTKNTPSKILEGVFFIA